MAFDNFTANIVSFPEITGVDWTIDNPFVTLILVPNPGYSINANNFEATNPLPSNVSSVDFVQSGDNVTCTVFYITPSIMPSNDVFIDVCASGFADKKVSNINGILKDCGISNVANPGIGVLPLSYSGSGEFESTANVLTQAVIADSGYYFEIEPVLSLSIGNISNYNITSQKTYNTDNQLTQIVFSVDYTFPSESVQGDEFCLVANAEVIYNPSVEIQAYGINSTPVDFSGEIRTFTIFGIQGAQWNLQYYKSATPNPILIGEFSGTINSSGSNSVNITFPSSLVNVDYTFILTGDLASSFCTTFPYSPCATGQPSVWQILQFAEQNVGFEFSSTNPKVTVGAENIKSFISGGSPGIQEYTVTATAVPNQTFAWNDGPPQVSDWSNQSLFPPDTSQLVNNQTITIDNIANPRTLSISLQTNITTVGSQNLTSVLNLDNFLATATIQPIQLYYGLTENDLCCNPSVVNYFILTGETFNDATSILESDGTTSAPDGFYGPYFVLE